MNPCRRTIRSIGVAAVIALSFGCGPRGENAEFPNSETTGTPNINSNWPFWPVTMRIHPLTRWAIEEKTNRLHLEARIEFLDAQGFRSKAVGRMDLVLIDAPPTGEPAVSEAAWSNDVYDPAINQQHFDIVTRTYLMKLEVEPDQVPPHPELSVTFTSANEVVMHATMKVRPYTP